MRYLGNIKPILLASMITILSASSVFGATNFKDVNEKHWAVSYINSVYEKGIMVGDTSGNFRPNEIMDKFDTSKILARIVGYKYTDLTDAETAYVKKVYDKNKNFLKQYENTFTKWSTYADKEISYLLEKEILTAEDLNQFVIKTEEGVEKRRALNKEEAAMFIVKSFGKKEAALTSTYDFKFADDGNINPKYKPYVYYLKDKNVFVPDKSNNFNPKSAVNRAIMATILDKTMNLFGASGKTVDVENDSVPLSIPEIDTDTDSNIVNVVTIVGTVDKYYDTLEALQIINSEGKKNIYKINKDINISVDGFIKTVDDLKNGMSFTGVLKDNEFVDIKANSMTKETETNPITNLQTSTIEGIIKEISNNYISIQINVINSKGDSILETRTYEINKECEITRDGKTEYLENVEAGDIVEASVSTKYVHSMNLNKKNLFLTGVLIDKNVDIVSGKPILVVKSDNKDYALQVVPSSSISKKGLGSITYNNLRIGDSVEVKIELNNIIDLYATGSKSSVEGVIDNVYISNSSSKISLNIDGESKTFNVVENKVDIYTLRIGSKIRASLDSLEIDDVKIISQPAHNNLTATIKGLKAFSMTVSEDGYSQKEISFDLNTTIINAYSGAKVSSFFLKENMQVYIVLENNTNKAKTITVLS